MDYRGTNTPTMISRRRSGGFAMTRHTNGNAGVVPGDNGNSAHPSPHVVIVGGGFGGLWAARALRDLPVRVTLIDRQNHHLFTPLLYQVATAALSPGDIAWPVRTVFRRQRNVTVVMAEATGVDAAARVVLAGDNLS